MAEQKDAENKSEVAEVEPRLTPSQQSAAAFLAANGYTHGVRTKGCLINRAATLVGYSRQTIHAWTKLPHFLQRIEALQVRLDALSTDGLTLAMQGIPERGVLPSVAACIAWKKARNPAVFDEQHRRDAAKREHELLMLQLKHDHEEKMLRLKAELGVIEPVDRPMPTFNYVEDEPGEVPPHIAGAIDTTKH